jgi:DNA helicase-2/ATP-dependent DNA helicase PcrA
MDAILDDLSESQRSAVQHGGGPLLVVAGAGSGKTRVVTRRIARLLRDGVAPSGILALTFTNKAAGEMARRVRALGVEATGADPGDVRVATFHSACARFLRVDGHLLGYPARFTIYDTYDRDTCIKLLLRDSGINAKVSPGDVGRRISRLKNEHIAPADFIGGSSEVDELVARVYAPYEARMRELGAMDFDDLLLRFAQLLADFPEVAAGYRERFRWILVDEFQDTNRVQYDIVRALAGDGERNVCVVGDPDQSIYRFRGAELGNILGFTRDYPDARVIRLEENYRSAGHILRAAQGVIEHNRRRLDKRLVPTRGEGDKVKLFVAASPDEEVREVVRGVHGLVAGGVPLDEIAVFYRAHHLSRGFEEGFRRAGINYELVGGIAFYERREVKDLLAYLRVGANPLDDVNCERILNVPPRGLGEVAQAALRTAAAARGLALAEAVADEEVRAQFRPAARRALAGLAQLFAELQQARMAAGALETVILRTDYLDYATTLGDAADYTREENIAELVGDAKTFDEQQAGGPFGYLQFVSLLTNEDRNAPSGPAATLMTVHAAKGLEFEHVFLAGLEEGLFPHSRSLAHPEDLEEERRLMYVAMTRARSGITLSWSRFRTVMGSTERARPSIFLREIPPEHVERIVPEHEDGVRFEPDVLPGDAAADLAADMPPAARVRHPVYGLGVVLRVAGTGIRAKALVRFDDGVDRNLLLEYAGLTVVEEGRLA